jgi:hypothetical protein
VERPGPAEDGTLYGLGDGPGRWTTLATARDTFDDFVLEMRAVHTDNAIAALYVRFKAMAGGVRGYRIALGGVEGKAKRPVTAGSVRREMPYEKEAPGKYDAKAPKGPLRRNELFTLRVTVTGNRVVTEINGQVAQEFEDRQGKLPPGQIALWLSGETAIQVKSVGVKEGK